MGRADPRAVGRPLDTQPKPTMGCRCPLGVSLQHCEFKNAAKPSSPLQDLSGLRRTTGTRHAAPQPAPAPPCAARYPVPPPRFSPPLIHPHPANSHSPCAARCPAPPSRCSPPLIHMHPHPANPHPLCAARCPAPPPRYSPPLIHMHPHPPNPHPPCAARCPAPPPRCSL